MVVSYKDKTELYRQRILDVLKEYGSLPKTRIAYRSKIQFYDAEILIKDLLEEGIIKKIDGTIVTYGLEGKK